MSCLGGGDGSRVHPVQVLSGHVLSGGRGGTLTM